MRWIFVVSVFAVILAGCNDKVYDVEFYRVNLDSRILKLEECKDNRESMRNDQNCFNASEADFQEYLELKGEKIEKAKKVIVSF